MDVVYIFAILNTIVIGVYVYSIGIFKFAGEGVDYLNILATKDSEKLIEDPNALPALQKQHLPNARKFISQETRIKAIFASAIIINSVNYAFYPYDTLLYSWMMYILISAAIFANIDILIIFFALKSNKRILSSICNIYYKITVEYDKNVQIEDTVISINVAFDEMMKDLNEAIKKDKNEDNEK